MAVSQLALSSLAAGCPELLLQHLRPTQYPVQWDMGESRRGETWGVQASHPSSDWSSHSRTFSTNLVPNLDFFLQISFKCIILAAKTKNEGL